MTAKLVPRQHSAGKPLKTRAILFLTYITNSNINISM